jgi:hypothetical protein
VKHIFARVLPPVQGVKGKLLEPLQGEQGGQLLQQPPLQQTPLLPVELLLYHDLAGLCRVEVPVILIQDRIFDTRFQDRTIDFTKNIDSSIYSELTMERLCRFDIEKKTSN